MGGIFLQCSLGQISQTRLIIKITEESFQIRFLVQPRSQSERAGPQKLQAQKNSFILLKAIADEILECSDSDSLV